MLRFRAGQANVLTLMILISATIVLALLLYSYFTGAYTSQSLIQQQIQYMSYYASNIQVSLEGFTNSTNLTITGGRYVYCGLLTMTNNAGETLSPAITILPGLPGPDGILRPEPAISRFPIDYTALPLERNLYMWVLLDINHDGIVDMAAGTPGGPYNIVLNRTATCLEIFNNATLKQPGYSLTPSNIEAKSVIVDIPTGTDLLVFIRQVYPDANDTFFLPAWQFLMEPGESVSLYFYAESPVALHRLSFVILAPYSDTYLGAQYVPVWNEAG